MERLTIHSGEPFGYTLKKMCGCDRTGGIDDMDGCTDTCDTHNHNCARCPINEAFNRLAAYEETGLSPAEVYVMKTMECSDTFQAHLSQLCNIKDNQIRQLKAENARLHKLVDEIEEILKGR